MKIFFIAFIGFFIAPLTVAQIKINDGNIATIRSQYRSLRTPTKYAQMSDSELSFILSGPSMQNTQEIAEALLEYQLRNDINVKHPSIRLIPNPNNNPIIKTHRSRQAQLAESLEAPFAANNKALVARCESLSSEFSSELISDFDVAIKILCDRDTNEKACVISNDSNKSNADDYTELAIHNYELVSHLLGESDATGGIAYENLCDGIGVNLNQHALKDKNMQKNPVALNHVIDNDYFNLSVSLANYTGNPLLPNWATFAQFGSRTVGRSMHLMEEAMKILDDIDAIINQGKVSQVGELPNHFARLKEIAYEPNMPSNGIKKFMDKFLSAKCNLSQILVPAGCAYLKTGNSILETKAELNTLYNAFKEGNRMIYNHMAPVLADFLKLNNQSKDCKTDVDSMYSSEKWTDLDPNGLIREALKEYQQANALDEMIKKTTDTQKKEELQQKRKKAVTRANLLIVTQEQILAQEHLYHHDKKAYAGMTTVLYDPVGEYPLVQGNWADFNTRMGIPKEVQDFSGQQHIALSADQIDSLLNTLTPGTITDYFDDRTSSTDAEKLFTAPVLATSAN